MITINEGTSCFVTVTFKDHDGQPVTPSSLFYRVDDVTSGGVIQDWMTVTPLAPEHTLELTAENYIINKAAPREERLITLRWVYGNNKQGTGEYRYLVRNLSKI